MQPLCEETARLLAPFQPDEHDHLLIDLNKEGTAFHIEAYRTMPWINQDRHHPSGRATAWFQRFPECRSLVTSASQRVLMRVPATDIAAGVIGTWPGRQMTASTAATQALQYLSTLTLAYEKTAEVVARYKSTKELPSHNIQLAPNYELSPYQLVGAYNGLLCPGYALFMDQGTGKTGVAITVICNDALQQQQQQQRRRKHPYLALVVVPPNVKVNWKNEFYNFGVGKGKVTIVEGDKFKRMKLWAEACTHHDDDGQPCDWSVMICSYDVIKGCWPMFGRTEWDCIALDESHFIKDPRTKRSNWILKLRDIAKKRLILTGTPIGNGIHDLYMQLEFLDKGLSGFETADSFKKFYNVYEETADGKQILVGNQNIPFIQERLARVSYRVTKKEALPELPEKLYSEREIEMMPDQAAVYREIAQNIYNEIEEELEKSDNEQMTINNALTKLLRLAQITAGFVVYDKVVDEFTGDLLRPQRIQHFNPNPKLELLMDNLRPIGKSLESKAIIWTNWVPCIELITQRIREEGFKVVQYYGETSKKDRLEAERAFNKDPYTKFLVGNPAACSVGLNLWGYDPDHADLYDSNCDHMFYYSQDWSSLKRQQSEDRAHRRKTRVPLNIIDLIVPGTIDEDIRVRVLKKQELSLKANDIKSILKAILVGINR